MMLVGTRGEAIRREKHYEFASSSGKTRLVKAPFIDWHLDSHPHHDLYHRYGEVQSQEASSDLFDPSTFPIAYLVRQEPNSVVDPHYHRVDQFQVFTRGNGHFGRHDIAPITIQYASAFTPYGPIVAGARGVDYLTLRGAWDQGAGWMPGARSRIPDPHHPRRFIVDWRADENRAPGTRRIYEESDGLGVSTISIDSGALVAGSDGVAACRYLYVLSGSGQFGDIDVEGETIVYLSALEAMPQLRAGRTGIVLMLLQFPIIHAA